MQARSRNILLVSAAIVGATSVLTIQWLARKWSGHSFDAIPAVTGVITNPGNQTQQEQEPRLRVNACRDLYSYVCASKRSSDPTGDVRHDAEGEVEVLRLYESLIRAHPGESMEVIDDLLVKEIYTPARTKRIRDLFATAREHLLKFIDLPPFRDLSEEQRKILKQRIESVVLELPPPASLYGDEPDLITRNDAFFERVAGGAIRIRMGGALLFTVKSKFNLAFTLVHELAHSIDPCEIKAANLLMPIYDNVVSCLGASHDMDQECSARGQLAETFADWVATHVVADILEQERQHYSGNELKNALFNSVRDLCQDDEEGFEDGSEGELSASHPKNDYRVNRIFAQHPQIREMLGCKQESIQFGPMLPGVLPSCYWPMTSSTSKGEVLNENK